MMELLSRLLELILIVWAVRFVLRSLLAGGGGGRSFRADRGAHPQAPPEPHVISGELKKDPNCGTYISTDRSIKTRYGGEILHFCSRECQQQFLESHAQKG